MWKAQTCCSFKEWTSTTEPLSARRPCTMRLQALAKILIDRGADVNATADDGATPLHEACRLGTTSVARILLTAGANVNARDVKGRTPLSCGFAEHYGKAPQELIDLVLEYGG